MARNRQATGSKKLDGKKIDRKWKKIEEIYKSKAFLHNLNHLSIYHP